MSAGGAGLALQIPAAFVEAVARRAAIMVLEQLGDRPGPDTPWMDQQEAGEYLRIPKGTWKMLVAGRRVPVHPEGKRNYFHRDELDRWRIDHPDAIAA